MNFAFRCFFGHCRVALVGAALLAVVGTAGAQGAQLANPASKNCVAQGGHVVIEQHPRGGEYGVCLFTDNRQCEEWAMLRGDCRAGGIRVTGYVMPAARYCAIRGGTYAVTAASNTSQERGTCSLANGKNCDAEAYFDGSCGRESAPVRTAGGLPASVRALFRCAGGKTIDATFANGNGSHVQLILSDGRNLTLPQAMSADGARYANSAEAIVFWNKGNTAFVQEDGRTTYSDCVTQR